MDHFVITEKNKILRMLGREAMRPYLWLTIAGVCFYTVIMDIPNIIWGDSAYTAEQLQEVFNDMFRYGVMPDVPRYYFIDSLYTFLITGPLLYGLTMFLLNIFRRKPTTTLEIFLGFSNFKKTFPHYAARVFMTIVGMILLVVPGFVFLYAYSMGFYLMCDDPNLGPIEAMKLSRRLMKGNKWKLFTLHLSFIGWVALFGLITTFLNAISMWLAVFANVFLSAFLTAYIRLTEVAFYEMLVGHLHRLDPEEVKANVNR